MKSNYSTVVSSTGTICLWIGLDWLAGTGVATTLRKTTLFLLLLSTTHVSGHFRQQDRTTKRPGKGEPMEGKRTLAGNRDRQQRSFCSQGNPEQKVEGSWLLRWQRPRAESDIMHRKHRKYSNFENRSFYYVMWAPDLRNHRKNDHSIGICSFFGIGLVYIRLYLVNPHVQRIQNMYGKGG